MSSAKFDIEEIGIKDPFKKPFTPLKERFIQWMERVYTKITAEKTDQERADAFLCFLRVFNLTQAVLIVVLIGYLAHYILYAIPVYKATFRQQIADIAQPRKRSNAAYVPKITSSALNSARFERRNVFIPYIDHAALDVQKALEAQNAYREISSAFFVVGIMMEAVPTAIIEERRTGITFFVKPNDAFQGATIDKIDDKTVHLTYKGHAIALPL